MPGWVIPAAMAGSTLIGGLMGQSAARRSAEDQQRILDEILNLYSGIDIPSIESQQLNLETVQQLGQLQPLLEQAIAIQGGGDIQIDPRLKQYQTQALDELMQTAMQGGFTDSDMAAIELSRRKAANEAQAQMASSLMAEAQRGRGGQSGVDLAARLMAGQEAADRQALEGLELQKDARNRALESLLSGGQLAQSQAAQNFSQDAANREYQTMVDQFNAQLATGAQQRNVMAQNQAQAANLGEAQRIAEQNANTRNQQQQYNRGLVQQDYQNQLQRAGGIGQALGQQAGFIGQQGQQQAGQIGQTTQGINQLLATYGMMNKNKDKA